MKRGHNKRVVSGGCGSRLDRASQPQNPKFSADDRESSQQSPALYIQLLISVPLTTAQSNCEQDEPMRQTRRQPGKICSSFLAVGMRGYGEDFV